MEFMEASSFHGSVYRASFHELPTRILILNSDGWLKGSRGATTVQFSAVAIEMPGMRPNAASPDRVTRLEDVRTVRVRRHAGVMEENYKMCNNYRGVLNKPHIFCIQ